MHLAILAIAKNQDVLGPPRAPVYKYPPVPPIISFEGPVPIVGEIGVE